MKLSIPVQAFEDAALNPGQIWATPRIGEWKHCTRRRIQRLPWYYFVPEAENFCVLFKQSILHGKDSTTFAIPYSFDGSEETYRIGVARLDNPLAILLKNKTYESRRALRVYLRTFSRSGGEKYGIDRAIIDFVSLSHQLKTILDTRKKEDWVRAITNFLSGTFCVGLPKTPADTMTKWVIQTLKSFSPYFRILGKSSLRKWRSLVLLIGGQVDFGDKEKALALLVLLNAAIDRKRPVHTPEPRRVKRRTPLRIRPPIQPNAPGF